MQIPNKFSILECERQLEKITHALGAHDLTMSVELRHRAAGGEAALAQLLITWAKLPHQGRILVKSKDTSDAALRDLVRRPYVCLAALLNRRVIESYSGKDITVEIYNAARDLISTSHETRYADISKFKGQFIGIICDDHHGYNTPSQFYTENSNGETILRPLDDIQLLMYNVFDELTHNPNHRQIDDKLMSDLAGCIFELFCNTHEHATRDINNLAIKLSNRGVYIQRNSLLIQAWKNVAGDYEPLANFINRIAAEKSGTLQMFEISVFDSGLGMAENWLKRPLASIDIEEERNAVETCFKEGKTTKRHGRYGQGLPAVIQHLRSQGAFLRLRTGRLSAYSDLGLERDRAIADPVNLHYWGWQGGIRAPHAAGTLLTLLIPIRVENQ